MEKTDLKKGDTIKFTDTELMIDMMYQLNREGIETDFLFEKDGEDGLWLIVTKIRSKNISKSRLKSIWKNVTDLIQ